MVNLSLHKIFYFFKPVAPASSSPLKDNINLESVLDDSTKLSNLQTCCKEELENICSTANVSKEFIISYILQILNCFPEIESKLGNGWNEKTYGLSDLRKFYDESMSTYETIRIYFQQMLGYIKTNTEIANITTKPIFWKILREAGMEYEYLTAKSFEERLAIFFTAIGLYTDWI